MISLGAEYSGRVSLWGLNIRGLDLFGAEHVVNISTFEYTNFQFKYYEMLTPLVLKLKYFLHFITQTSEVEKLRFF